MESPLPPAPIHFCHLPPPATWDTAAAGILGILTFRWAACCHHSTYYHHHYHSTFKFYHSTGHSHSLPTLGICILGGYFNKRSTIPIQIPTTVRFSFIRRHLTGNHHSPLFLGRRMERDILSFPDPIPLEGGNRSPPLPPPSPATPCPCHLCQVGRWHAWIPGVR